MAAGQRLDRGALLRRQLDRIFAGRVKALLDPESPRTTLMKLATLSTLWDYINRAMPPNLYNIPVPPDEKLTADEVYALTAFLLYRNGIIAETEVIDADSLPKIEMPNRNGFVPADLDEVLDYRGRGCRAGTCP